MNEPLIGIVTVLYNSETVLDDFFTTLSKQKYKNIKLYVVDNKSPDNSLNKSKELSKKCFFESVFIANPQNDGVAKGNNLGIAMAITDRCEYILLSNNDIVLNENTILNLYEATIRSNVSISVPKIYSFYNDHLWFAGGNFDKLTFKSKHIGFNKIDNGLFDKESFITYSPTCFMLIHKRVFDKVGMMDEKFFVYWDDTDFVYRAQKKGFKILYVPTSTMKHKESVCTGNKSDFFYRYIYRNREYFINKHSGISWIRHFMDFVYLFTVMIFKMRGNKYQWNIVRKAMIEGCRM